MSRKKSKYRNNKPLTNPDQGRSEEKTTKRHVYVEPGVKIDFVKDFREEYKTSQSDSASHNKKQLFWTKVASVLLLLTAGFTFWQGRLVHKSNVINKQSADAATKAANTAVQTMYLGERAWVAPQGAATVNPPKNVIEIGKPLIVRVGFENSGKSPATNVRVWHFGAYDHTNGSVPEAPPSVDLSKYSPKLLGAMMPYSTLTSHFSDVTVSSKLLKKDYEAIKADKLHIFAHGKIIYCDIFGREHWATFCYHLLAGGAYAVCKNNNDVDQESKVTQCPVTDSHFQ